MKKSYILIVLLSQVLMACSDTTNPPLAEQVTNTPPPVAERRQSTGGRANQIENPKAEILFVIDNSGSMADHIANVSRNIDKFVDGFVGKVPLDFNIAVTSVHDSRKFGSKAYLEQFGDTDMQRDQGEFYDVPEASGNQYFLSSNDPNLKVKLKTYLKIGTQSLAEGGPEVEELLSPLEAVYLSRQSHPTHSNFFMGPDSYKIIIFISDASDLSNFDITDFHNRLLTRVSSPDKLMAFGAYYADSDRRNASSSCSKRDPGAQNSRLDDFLDRARPAIAKSGENKVHLCNRNFGSALAKFGQLIRQQTQNYSIQLTHGEPNVLDIDSEDSDKGIWLMYGEQRLLKKEGAYDITPETQTINITPGAITEVVPGAKFSVTYTPIIPSDEITVLGEPAPQNPDSEAVAQ